MSMDDPDRNEDAESERRMAQVNAAYDLLRAGGGALAPSARPERAEPSGRGSWLSTAVRRALGRELLEALEPGEEVRWVTPTATWASARALLVVTDRRLLWLLDDVVTARVHWLRLSRIASARGLGGGPGGRPARVGVAGAAGRTLRFAARPPPTADAIARALSPSPGRS